MPFGSQLYGKLRVNYGKEFRSVENYDTQKVLILAKRPKQLKG